MFTIHCMFYFYIKVNDWFANSVWNSSSTIGLWFGDIFFGLVTPLQTGLTLLTVIDWQWVCRPLGYSLREPHLHSQPYVNDSSANTQYCVCQIVTAPHTQGHQSLVSLGFHTSINQVYPDGPYTVAAFVFFISFLFYVESGRWIWFLFGLSTTCRQ